MVYKLLIGTYNHIAQSATTSRGVYLYRLDTSTLQATCLDSVMVSNPSWVTEHLGNAYALSECGNESLLHSIAINGDKLCLTSSIASPGADPCHLAVIEGKLYAANYSSGSLSVVNINADGTLGSIAQDITFTEHGTSPRQLAAHLHNIAVAPGDDIMAVSNLGGDCIYVLERQGDGTLSLLSTVHTTPGSGPRHMAWNATGDRLYLITELSDEVMTFAFNGTALKLLQTDVAARTPGHGAGHILMHPSGKWLYASVRLVDDGIAQFTVMPDGTLQRTAFYPTGRHPRHFAVTPCGTLLMCACRDKNAIELYRINQQDGTLTRLPQHDVEVPLPVCISIV